MYITLLKAIIVKMTPVGTKIETEQYHRKHWESNERTALQNNISN